MQWKQPKENSDEMKKFTKTFLTYAESVTEAEAKVINWAPSNYQDPKVKGSVESNIGELRLKGSSETFWVVKLMDDGDGTHKPQPYFVIYNGDRHLEVAKLVDSEWSGTEVEETKKFKQIVDDDLISTDPIVYKSRVVTEDDDDLV